MIQLELQARHTDPPASHDAKRKARPRAGSDAAVILLEIEVFPSQSARKIASNAGIEPYIVRKRTADLRRLELAHAHVGGLTFSGDRSDDRELRWYPGTTCWRCKRGEAKR